MENKFMRVEEVAEVLEVSTSFAYKVIRQLNDELKAKDADSFIETGMKSFIRMIGNMIDMFLFLMKKLKILFA